MAIEKYTTECLVIESFDQGEHDRVFKIFTRDFGMIFVHAKSIRKLESKLRSHILPRSRSLVTLVEGRETWRLVGAESIFLKKESLEEVTLLLKRFVRGEGAHKTLYDRLIEFLEKSSSYENKMSRVLLFYILLVELGYADARAIGAKDLKEYISWTVEDLYVHLVLSYENVRNHIHEVLQDIHL